jgi:hypothetical protein
VAKIWKRKSRDTWTVDYRDASGVRRRLTAKSREEVENLLSGEGQGVSPGRAARP